MFAAEGQGILVEPAFQEITLDEHTASIAGQISLTNKTTEDQVFQLIATDIQQFDADGKIILADKPLTGADYTLADFIQLPSTQSAVAAGQTLSIPFTIRNGPDLQPGGHYSALVLRSVLQRESTDQQVLPAITSFLLVHKVGGERYHLSLLPTQLAERSLVFHLPEELSLTFSNQGNTHVRPYGLVRITDVFGHEVKKGIINEGSAVVLPGTQRTLSVKLSGTTSFWPIMLYSLKISGESNPGSVAFTQEATFFALNLPELGAALLLIVAVIFLLRRKRGR